MTNSNNSLDTADATELAAAINAAASIMAKGKHHEEVEMQATLFRMLADTLHSIARVERMQERLRHENERRHKERLERMERLESERKKSGRDNVK